MIHNVFGHAILDSQIIGVSPLYVKPSTDQITAQLYNPVKFHFQVHTLHQSITIESEWLNLYGSADEKQLRQDKYKKLADDYQAAIDAIKELLTQKS